MVGKMWGTLAGIGRKYPIDFEVWRKLQELTTNRGIPLMKIKPRLCKIKRIFHSGRCGAFRNGEPPSGNLVSWDSETVFCFHWGKKGYFLNTDYMFICLLIRQRQKKWDADMENHFIIWSMQDRWAAAGWIHSLFFIHQWCMADKDSSRNNIRKVLEKHYTTRISSWFMSGDWKIALW